MGTVTTLPRGRPFTRTDLDAMPDDGHRYELIDGALIVTPALSATHQTVVLELAVLLRERCPSSLKVLVAPFDVALTDDTIMQPDLLVARRSDLTERDLPVAPVLAVEVLSASTRRIDLTLKRSRLEAAGCPHFWVVDPLEPAMTAWELRTGAYVEVGHVTADQTLSVHEPFAVDVVPAQLIAG
jgi:Uma2 family endonuclease